MEEICSFFRIIGIYSVNLRSIFNIRCNEQSRRFWPFTSIPIDLKYNIPLKSADPFIYQDKDKTAQVDSTDSNTWLQIWDDFGQGGIYKYDFYYGTLPAGEIFLKCYEVTDNYRLSEERLTEASKVEIPANSSFAKIVGSFCIIF